MSTTPPARQLALQAAAALLVLSLAWPYHGVTADELDWQLISYGIGGTAFALASLCRQAWWWRLIHLVFAPLAWTLTQVAIDPGWYLLGFLLLLLLFRGAPIEQVPLYFSAEAASLRLAELIEQRDARSIVDLGAGIGSIVVPLARRFPERRFTGIEHAPLPWLAGWLRTRRLANCDWRWGSLWASDLGRFDLVYAFLSPAPMTALGEKARREMRRGSVLVSNSFEIPEQAASFSLIAGERTLHAYIL